MPTSEENDCRINGGHDVVGGYAPAAWEILQLADGWRFPDVEEAEEGEEIEGEEGAAEGEESAAEGDEAPAEGGGE